MNWKSKKVLVTGAEGFIGSHLIERLIELKADVTGFVRYNSKDDVGWLNKVDVDVFRGDLLGFSTVKDAMKGKDYVFHLGASISVPYSIQYPSEAINVNTIGTLNVLNAAKELGTSKVVVTSSSEVYGSAVSIPIKEDHMLQAQSPYAASKIAGDKMAECFYDCYNLPVAIIRPFNTYGPRQSTRAVIPTIITQALVNKKVKLGALNTTRDFNFVKDTVNGFVKVMESDKAIGQVINIGSGKETSINDLVKLIAELIGKVELIQDKQRLRPEKSEVMRLCADNSKAKQLISWEPKFSLKDGLKITVDWFKENINKYDVERYNI